MWVVVERVSETTFNREGQMYLEYLFSNAGLSCSFYTFLLKFSTKFFNHSQNLDNFETTLGNDIKIRVATWSLIRSVLNFRSQGKWRSHVFKNKNGGPTLRLDRNGLKRVVCLWNVKVIYIEGITVGRGSCTLAETPPYHKIIDTRKFSWLAKFSRFSF